MATTIFETKDTVLFVGGRGTKAGDADAGGGCTKDYWGDLKNPNKTLADVMGTNGEPLSDPSAWNGSQTACNATNNGSGKVRITKTAAFGNCEAGHIANVAFTPLDINRYEVIAVNANYIDIDLAYSSDKSCDVKVGGAFDLILTASDESSASSGLTPKNVYILTNKARTFSGAGDEIDIDVGGGDGGKGTWKRIIGINDNGVELAKGSYVDIDGNGQACHVFKILDIENIEIRHIYAHDSSSSYYGFYVTATGYKQGFFLRSCKSTGCKYGIYSDTYYIRGLTIMGGYYSSATGPALCFNYCRWVYVMGAVLTGNLAGALIDGDVVGPLHVEGCLLYKTGNYILGIKCDNYDTYLILKNCVFYNIDNCIYLNDAEARLFQINNIFVLHTAASGKIINRTAGAIKYSGYSCAWAIDGAPAASDRWGGTGLPENSNEADPQFEDAANGDFRLKMSSPCLRMGNPTLGKL